MTKYLTKYLAKFVTKYLTKYHKVSNKVPSKYMRELTFQNLRNLGWLVAIAHCFLPLLAVQN